MGKSGCRTCSRSIRASEHTSGIVSTESYAQPSTHEGEWRRLLGLGPPTADGAEEVEAGWATLPPPLAVDARVRRLLGRGVPAPLRGRVWFALLRRNPNLNPNPNPNPNLDPNQVRAAARRA